MRTRHRLFLAALLLLLTASCDNPREEFKLIQDLSSEDLRMGLSFDLNMEEGYTYTTAVVCRIDATAAVKDQVDLNFDVISPDHASYKESISFPLVTNVRQQAALGRDSGVMFKKRGTNIDNQWGWRSGISCDSIPGRWRVIISVQDPTDLERIRAIGTERIETEARIAEAAKHREEFRVCFDRAGAEAVKNLVQN